MRMTIVAAILAAGVSAAGATETLRFGHVYETSSIYHEAAVWAADEIAKRTEGRYAIEVFPASSIGNENDLFQGLALGAVDLVFTGSFYASGIHGPMAISSGPFMFRDYDHWKAYRDSDLFAEIAAEFEKKSAHKVLGLTYYGARHLTSNRRIERPEDMKGMKLRVPNAPMYLLFPKSVGANAAPIAFAEVYLALQQGVVEGQENPLPTILAKKFYEVQSHIMLTGHLMDSLVTVAGGGAWNGMSDADRAIFSAVYDEAARRASELVRQSEADLATRFATEFGVTVVTVDREPFRKAMAPLLEGADMPWTADQVARVQAIR